MSQRHGEHDLPKRRSIFRSLFFPLFLIMIVQALIFYFAAVYGGIEESLRQNAADILSERLNNRKSEIETQFNGNWADLDTCRAALDALRDGYEARYDAASLAADPALQIAFLRDAADPLVTALRRNEVNGIFLILNDQTARQPFAENETKYGLCIRDMDEQSNYIGREDLLLERAPSSIVDALGCSLDSWWEAKYRFTSEAAGDFYYAPLNAAWDNPGADGDDLAYCTGMHRLSGSDSEVFTYSLPLIARDGAPYGVLGIELTARHLSALLPSGELHQSEKGCYLLAWRERDSAEVLPILGTGATYSRCFETGAPISIADTADIGGYWVTGRGNLALYAGGESLHIYNNNNPFEDRELTLLAMVERGALFAHIDRVRFTLLVVAAISLTIGVGGIAFVSRRFAAPITALAERVRGMQPQAGFALGRLGISEIDMLVDAIEELNQNVSRGSARTEFFSRMSHDMRTPMNAIIGFSSKDLLEGADEQTKDEYLQKIHDSGEFLLTLINDVLDMTKIESNRTELHYAPVRADLLCGTVAAIIDKLAQKKHQHFIWRIDADASTYVLVDEQHLSQIVMNLLSNAVKFTPEGGTVRFTLTVSDDPADAARVHCRIVVADTGIGMSEDFMKRLYTPFEQENSRQEGTGLGLPIVKRLVELMDGTIDCESHLGAGTTFTADIPLAKGEAQDGAAAENVEAASIYDILRGKHILVCEDNNLNTIILCKLLERRGIVTTSAENGKLGAETFAASAPGAFDAILMDIRMPVMDGLEATRAMRAMDRPDAKTIPIFAMTANAFEQDVQASMDAGMNGHLSKPIESEKLFEALARSMDTSKT